MLRPQFVRKNRPVAYPTRLEVLIQPELLEKHQPSNWQRHPELQATVAVLLAVNTLLGCKSGSLGNVAAEPKAAVVAPIFEHGEGRGVTVCVVVNAPVFLSEEEVRQVIREELTSAGLDLTQSDIEKPTVKFAQHFEDPPTIGAVMDIDDHRYVQTLVNEILPVLCRYEQMLASFCGAWEDIRNPKEIVDELYRLRENLSLREVIM